MREFLLPQIDDLWPSSASIFDIVVARIRQVCGQVSTSDEAESLECPQMRRESTKGESTMETRESTIGTRESTIGARESTIGTPALLVDDF